jgi:NAD(P)-dependent dehydrogenase (short-subunit alcohol dehydrogenase family)
MCKYVGPVMKAQKSGKIVNMSSMASRGESQADSAYGAAKAGIISFTRKLSRELGPCGINCNGIAPALVLTNRINRTIGAVSPEVAAERAGIYHFVEIPCRKIKRWSWPSAPRAMPT